MNIVAPNVKNLVRGGAIVYFDRGNTGAYVDLGNIPEWSASTPTQFVEHKTARSGAIIMDRREPTEFSNMYKFGMEELNTFNLALLFNSATPSAFSQSSATATTLNIATPTLGMAYPLGAYKVTNVVVKVLTVTKVLGVDYSLEADLGMIVPLPTGSILNTDTMIVTFNAPALTGDQIAPLSMPSAISGACKAFFRTSDGRLWLRAHTNVQMAFQGDTAFEGNAFAKTQGELLFMPDYSNAAQPFGTLVTLPSS